MSGVEEAGDVGLGAVGLEGVSWGLLGKGLGMWAEGMRGCRAGGQL